VTPRLESERALSVLICATLLLATAGCAARPKKVTLAVPASHPVQIASVEIEPGAARVVNVGTYKVGKYKSHDLRVLKQMLNKAIPVHGASKESFQVHVVVRSFLIAHDNTKGAGLACIAWALTDPDRELVFDEQFYASRRSPPLSIGGIKNRIHVGITKRIHQRAQDVASGRPLSPPPEDTYNGFERAASQVPNNLRSDLPTIFGGYDQWGNPVGLHRTVRGQSQEGSARHYDAIDWYNRLGIPRPPDAPAPETLRPGTFPPTGYPRTGYPGSP
jgi:hypothetical protein